MLKRGFMDLNRKALTVEQPVFIWKGVVFYPHYKLSNVWCGPGTTKDNSDNTFTTSQLMLAGAKQSTRYLWERSWTK